MATENGGFRRNQKEIFAEVAPWAGRKFPESVFLKVTERVNEKISLANRASLRIWRSSSGFALGEMKVIFARPEPS